MPPAAQVSVDPQLLGLEAQLVQTTSLGDPRLPVRQLGERGPVPQRERLGQLERGPVGLAQGEQLARAADDALEPHRIDLVGGKREHVSLGCGIDRVRAELLAQPDDAALQDLGRRRRGPISPQSVDELVDADGVTGARRQCLKNHPISRAEPSRAIHRERTEHRDAHPSKFLPAPDSVNRVDTASIPVWSPTGTGRCQNRTARGNRPRTSRRRTMNTRQNSLTLTSDSRRWWWPSATAGGVGLAAVAAIVVLPTAGSAIPVDHTGQVPDVDGAVLLVEHAGPAHPCFLVRARWNTALDGPQPVCRGVATGHAVPVARVAPAAPRVLRTGLDAMP